MVEVVGLERRAAIHAALGEPARLAMVDALIFGDAAPGELGELLGLPSNLLAHHLRVLEEAGVVRRARAVALGDTGSESMPSAAFRAGVDFS